jgi:hypothetical protein
MWRNIEGIMPSVLEDVCIKLLTAAENDPALADLPFHPDGVGGRYLSPDASRVTTSTSLRPTANAFHRLKLLMVLLLLKVIKLAAARITCQLAQYLFHRQNLCIVIDARAKIVIGKTLSAIYGRDMD